MTNKEITATTEITLLDAIEQIVTLAEDSKLTPEFYASAAPYINIVAERMNLSREQAVLLSAFLNLAPRFTDYSDLAHFFDCSQITILRYMNNVESLAKSRHLKCTTIDGEKQYQLNKEVIDAIRNNVAYEPPCRTGLGLMEFFEVLNGIFDNSDNDSFSFGDMVDEVEELVTLNPHLPLIAALNTLELDRAENMFFLYCCNMLVSNDDRVITNRDLHKLFDKRKVIARNIFTDLVRGHSSLQKRGLLQNSFVDSMASPNTFELTPYVCKELLECIAGDNTLAKSRQLTDYTTITPKDLFYNPREERSLSQLASLLEQEKFKTICDRLEQKGMRRGFACLFYGAPGTGKTETVLQLARRTGRDLMLVDMSSIRSKWVGESEQNVKAIFDTYRRLVKESEVAPILFLNEADAIISKRSGNVERSVDKMENAIQNIILQEIENLEGILIATTNLTSNMDSAFERRFIYKIEFSKPTIEAKSAIWRSMIPSLSAEDATMLATRYDFSGGQIENISRKCAIEEILSGNEVPTARLTEFCNEERLDDNAPRRRIGYVQ